MLGGQGEIAFVFAVFVVNDDKDAAGLDLGDGFGDAGEHAGLLESAGSGSGMRIFSFAFGLGSGKAC